MIKTDAGRLLCENIVPLTLLQGFEKGYSRFACERELEIEQNCNILTLTLMAVMLCLSCSPDAQSEVQRPTMLGDGFIYCILSATSLVPELPRGSRGPPRPGVAFPTTSRLSPTGTLLEPPVELNCLDFRLD